MSDHFTRLCMKGLIWILVERWNRFFRWYFFLNNLDILMPWVIKTFSPTFSQKYFTLSWFLHKYLMRSVNWKSSQLLFLMQKMFFLFCLHSICLLRTILSYNLASFSMDFKKFLSSSVMIVITRNSKRYIHVQIQMSVYRRQNE